MVKTKIVDRIYEYVEKTYGYSKPFFLKELYVEFPDVKQGTIREYMRRLLNNGKVIKAKNGVYELPNPNRILKNPTVSISKVVNQSYLFDSDGRRIGYQSGFNFANQIGLTTQTASVTTIFSNAVSKKKRNITLNKNRLIINAPRVEINDDNYRLLQVLDLLIKYEMYSEYNLKKVSQKLIKYFSRGNLSTEKIEEIVDEYPLEAQVKFYKMGGSNVIT